MSKFTAVIAGPSGLVGNQLVQQLIADPYYKKVILLTRRPLNYNNARLEQVVVEDFDHLKEFEDKLIGDDFYCCLGTTIKQAGSKEKFKKVDLSYPVEFAQIAQKSPGFRKFLVVTAAGSNSDSPLFYNQVKGELENTLKEMGIQGLRIFRPSLLLGERKEFRIGEEIAKFISSFFSFFMIGLKRKLWAIKASDVAQAMFLVAKEEGLTYASYSSKDMRDMVKKAMKN